MNEDSHYIRHWKLFLGDADDHLRRWASFRNDGALHYPGPDGTSNPGFEPDTFSAEDREAWLLVERVFDSIGRGIYSPDVLRALSVHVYWHGQSPESFRLFQDPSRAMPREIMGLGFKSPDLVRTALSRLRKLVAMKVAARMKRGAA